MSDLLGLDKISYNKRDLRHHNIFGYIVFILLLGGSTFWILNAELRSAIIAPGVVVVETNLKKIQHPTGGIVGRLSIKEGQEVKQGDLLVGLDETTTRANLAILTNQVNQALGRRARLVAERDSAEIISFPSKLVEFSQNDSETERLVVGESSIFLARLLQRTGQKTQLRERINQFQREIEGLSAQRIAKEREIQLIRSELVGIEDLYKKNLVPFNRVILLQREETRLEGERGALIAQSASALGKISEIELQILNLDGDFRAEVTRDLRETEAKIAELSERQVAAEDQLRRIDLRSPVSGIVHQVAVHTIGGVIQPGETLMQIVPIDDSLIIEAKVAPADIEPVYIGAKAYLRFTSLNQRITPELIGTVSHVAPDLSRDNQTGASFFMVRVRLVEEQIVRLGAQRLLPGMPVEVYIQTEQKTAFIYLMKPIFDQFSRALKER
jgi:HlyD family secretion protein